jgi:hypothetical protein
MKTFSKILLTVILVLGIAAGITFVAGGPATAATSNPTTGSPGYQILVAPVSRITTTTSGIVKLKAPWPFRIVMVSAVSNTYTGVVTVDVVNAAGTSVLTSAVTLSTVVSEGTLTTASTLNITDETNLSINTAGTGTANDTTVQIDIKRL